METIIKWLSATIPRVKTPLSLAALMLVILYALVNQILSLKIFSGIDSQSTYQLLSRVLDILLYLGMTCVVLAAGCYMFGPALNRRELSKRRSRVELIDIEVDHPAKNGPAAQRSARRNGGSGPAQ